MHHLCQEGYTGILGPSLPDLCKQRKVKIDIYPRRAKIVRISTGVLFASEKKTKIPKKKPKMSIKMPKKIRKTPKISIKRPFGQV